MKILSTAVGVFALASSFSIAPVHASTLANAVESCQGALPNFEGALRKRPLAVSNEGASSAFVSCSMATSLGSTSGVTDVIALFSNRTATAATIRCTLVGGLAQFPDTVYLPKTLAVSANASAVLSWTDGTDNGGNAFFLANLSCALPPGTEINAIQTNFT